METEIETRVCPRCKKPMVFQEICESNPGEIKSMWSCELCGILIYIMEEILYDSGWKKLKQGGSNHYKSGTVEPIDLYKAGNMFHDFACASIMKYAFRSRKEMNLNKELFNKNMDKIIHYASLLKAMRDE